jgi:O-acetyl-ADP-ribose deacetylase (regulator of RNase III)
MTVVFVTWDMAVIEVIQADITKLKVDAIVNAANSSLMGGGGVDGAIHRAAGPELLEACRQIVARQGGCKTGEAVITPAGRLPCRYVIHTVGPVWRGGNNNEEEHLALCYKNSLKLAVSNEIRTIAFPNISTGVYGFPRQQAAIIAIETVQTYLIAKPGIEKLTFVCFDTENLALYTSIIKS